MAKREYVLLPKGTLVYPKLDEVDVYQPTKKDGSPKGPAIRKFVTGVSYGPKEQAEVEKLLRDAAKKLGAEDAKTIRLPFKENKEGTQVLSAKRAEKLGPPMMFDGKNKKLPTLAVGGGTVARVKVAVNIDTDEKTDEEFVFLYVDQLQIIKFVEKQSGRSAFEEADDEDAFEYNAEKAEARAEGPDLDADGSDAADL